MAGKIFKILPKGLREKLHHSKHHLFVDHAQIENIIFMIGSFRSGTTWVQELLTDRDTRVMTEPFNKTFVPSPDFYNFCYYCEPQDENPELDSYISRVLNGKINCWFSDRENKPFRKYQRRFIKSTLSQYFIKRIRDQYPAVFMLSLLRHPVPTCLSQYEKMYVANSESLDQWVLPPFFEIMRTRKKMHEKILDPLGLTIPSDDEDPRIKLIFGWFVENYIMIQQLQPEDTFVITYEDILLQPDQEIERLKKAAGGKLGNIKLENLDKPSVSTLSDRKQISSEERLRGWKKPENQFLEDYALELEEKFQLKGILTDIGISREGVEKKLAEIGE